MSHCRGVVRYLLWHGLRLITSSIISVVVQEAMQEHAGLLRKHALADLLRCRLLIGTLAFHVAVHARDEPSRIPLHVPEDVPNSLRAAKTSPPRSHSANDSPF